VGSIDDLIQQALKAGLRVERHGDNIRIRGPREAAPLIRSLRAHKTAILAFLRKKELGGDAAMETQMPPNPQKTAIVSPVGGISSPPMGCSPVLEGNRKAVRDAWSQILTQVSDAWCAHAAEVEASGQEPAWIDDEDLMSEVRAGVLAGDLASTLAAASVWRRAWEDAMATASGLPAALVKAASEASAGPLFDWLTDPSPLRRVAARREIHARADQILAEVDGLRAPPNASVHRMFDDARRRFGYRDLEERSLTVWLKKNAPAVAALWPEAPVDAAWIDWRQKVGPDHNELLDRAFAAMQEKYVGPGQDETGSCPPPQAKKATRSRRPGPLA
jgi:hypothetical protein